MLASGLSYHCRLLQTVHKTIERISLSWEGAAMLENLAGCLEGKVAWITGSSRGLGRVMADELCRLGAKVAVHGTREDSPTTFDEGSTMHDLAAELSEAHAGDAMATWCDVTDPDAVEAVAQSIRDKWGQIDILVTCAGGDIGRKGTSYGSGGQPDDDDCLNIDLDDLKSVLDRNLMGTIHCCRSVVPEMIERKSGKVITIGSIGGLFGRTNGSTYSVAKAAVHSYTRCLAAQVRPHNIQVNCVAPGPTVTERFLRIHEIDDEKLTEEGTLERYGRPREVATLVGFLATEAAEFISGQVLRVAGALQTFAG